MFSPDDPIYLIYTPTAQCLVCLGCLKAFHPDQMLPAMLFVLVGKEFVKVHRWCKPHYKFRDLLAHIASNEVSRFREPGIEG